MKIPSKLSRFLGNEKARTQLLSGIVVALLTLTAVTGFLVALPKQASAAEIVSEDCEDMSDWTSFGLNTWEVSSYVKHEGNNSLHLLDETDTDSIKMTKSISLSESAFTVQYWLYFNTTTTDQNAISIRTNGTSNNEFQGCRIAQGNNTPYIRYWEDDSMTSVYSTNTTLSPGTWYNITWIGDHGTQKVYVDGSCAIVSSMPDDGDTFLQAYISATAGSNLLDLYVDDIHIYNTTDPWSGGSTSPSAPTSVSATNYVVNFTASGSVSGFDTNNRLTFPEASVNDTAGDTVWSNATSYGTITLTNDGINQINISWTKGTGATNTIVEVDTSDHSPWNVGTGMEIYNGTGTSTIFDYNDDGTVTFDTETTYYFALFSYNASGYSGAATTSVTSGNVSIDTVNIHIEDIGSGDNLVPRENLTVYEAGSTTGGWTFDAVTGNVSISTANGLPLAPGDASIQFVIKSNVPPGIANGTYYDGGAASLDCSITIGHTA